MDLMQIVNKYEKVIGTKGVNYAFNKASEFRNNNMDLLYKNTDKYVDLWLKNFEHKCRLVSDSYLYNILENN